MKKALTLLWAPVIAAALFACASQTQVQSPYDDTVARADVLLEIPEAVRRIYLRNDVCADADEPAFPI